MTVCVLGSINLDVVLRVADLPRPGETIAAQALSEHPGGKGANQAVAAARMGASTLLVGAVGRDDAGTWLRDYLRQAEVDLAEIVEIAEQPTGRAFICVSDAGENSIVVVGGANLAIGPGHLRPAALARSRVFLAQLETPVPVIQAMFSDASAAAGTRILNAAPAIPEGKALFPLADILVVNETELAAYAGVAFEPGSQACIDAARRLISKRDQVVILTLGAAGVAVVEAETSYTVAGRAMPVVDTTGAGDCFCGALAARLGEGATLADAVDFANAAAGLSVGRAGAASSIPSRAEVDALRA